jgi:acetyl/propionyl-CoA carboxylase alpha subunit
MKVFNKILVANRGEIAVRIFRTLKSLGINSVAVYSEKDAGSLHVRLADEAYLLSGDTLRDTYLSIEKIIEVAKETGAEAIHPGYGFLSENASFSHRVAEEGINFIGPTGEVIGLMGNKLEARSVARRAGVPLIEGFEGKAEEILENVRELQFPVIVKAAAGGGGKAMRIVRDENEFHEALEVTKREAFNYFADDTLYVEKYFEKARHIEIQVLADHYGNIIIPGERECSIQRRYQKVIEETPSRFLKPETRKKMFETSRKIVKEISYANAGTIEFLVDEDQNFYFLEMNTRIQVEHPVTEETTGLDLVEQQIYIAAGNQLTIKQDDIKIKGHSVQARIYAEDPARNFLPAPGNVWSYVEPRFPGLRIDAGIDSPGIIRPDFDPMIAKVIATAFTRDEAIRLLQKSLINYKVTGLFTNREFLISLLNDPDFLNNIISTTWLEKNRSKILNDQKIRREEISRVNIFSAWLVMVLFTRKMEKQDVWHEVGYWRHQVRKSFVFEGEQIDLYVSEKKKDRIRFSLEDNEYELQLRSMKEEQIIFLVNGQWNCATVTTAKEIDDIVFMDGYEFRIKPMDYLPEVPFLRDNYGENVTGPRIIKSPLHGRIVKLNAVLNKRISRGDLLFILDAMKIENKVTSPWEGCIREIRIKEGDQVSIDQDILIIDDCK